MMADMIVPLIPILDLHMVDGVDQAKSDALLSDLNIPVSTPSI